MENKSQPEDLNNNQPAEDMSKTLNIGGKAPGKLKSNMIMALVGSGLIILGLAIGAFLWLSGGNDDTPLASTPEESSEASESTSLQAAITLVEGNVQYSSDSLAWTDAIGGETVGEGDYIRTLTASRTVVLLDDGSAVRLDADSSIQLASSNSQYVEIKLMGGQVYTRVVENGSRVFSVATDSDSYEAQGTAYSTSTIDGSDEVSVYQSKVKVKSSGDIVDEGKTYDSEDKAVQDIDTDKLTEDEFAQWNKEQDVNSGLSVEMLGVLEKKVDEPAPEIVTPEPAPAPSAGTPASNNIILSGAPTDKGVKLTWQMGSTATKDGFKIVRDKTDSTPTYGANSSTYVGDNSSRSYTLDIKDGKSYYFRICVYSEGTCSDYSNSVKVAAPYVAIEEVVPGTITLSINDDDDGLTWTYTGTAPHGFKVVRSLSPNPTYPNDSPVYTQSTSYNIPDLGTDLAYFRVCKYTASDAHGGCTDYSNQIEY